MTTRDERWEDVFVSFTTYTYTYEDGWSVGLTEIYIDVHYKHWVSWAQQIVDETDWAEFKDNPEIFGFFMNEMVARVDLDLDKKHPR